MGEELVMRKKAELGDSKAGEILKNLLPKKKEKKKSVLTMSTITELKKVFDKRGLQFFLFYVRLRELATKKDLTPEDKDLLGDLNQSFARMVKLFIKQKDKQGNALSSITVGKVMSALQELFPLLDRFGKMILSGKPQDSLTKRIVSIYVPVMSEVAKEKNIFIQGKPLGGEKSWQSLGKMIPSVAKIEKLKDEDPFAYEVMTKRKEQFDEVQKAVEEQIKEAGYTYEKKYMRVGYKKTLVHIGKDPNTGEAFVYDPMDQTKSGVPITEYLEKAMQTEKALKEAVKENQKRGRVAEYSEKVALKRLDEMRIPNWEVISQQLEGDTEFVSLYDDLAKQGGLTKIIPTKELDLEDQKVKVVTSGRYEGVLFDELVNVRGRLIEGNSYAFDDKLQRPVQVKPGEREPYVSVATVKKRVGKGQYIEKRVLFLEFPSKKGKGLNEEKNRIKKLGKDLDKGTGGKVDSISWKRLSSNSHIGVYFEPKDFALIRRNLSSMALSAEATRLIREYNEDLAKAQVATEEKNLEFYTPESLGGFKPVLDNGREFKLLHKQKQGIAWLDANDNKGVLALDTGIGKCCEENTMISTNKGLVPIKELNPNITTPDTLVPISGWGVVVDGKELPIKNFYYGGEKPTLKVKTRYGFSVEGSLVHPLLVRTANGMEEWIKTPELKVGDYICVERKEGAFPKEEPLLDSFEGMPSKMNPDLARLFAYVVAEGWADLNKMFSFSSHEKANFEIRSDIQNLIESQLGSEVNSSTDKLMSFFRLNGVEKTTPHLKTIPACILQATKESARQFLRGFIEAEGNLHSHCLEILTSSQTLVDQLQLLLLRFGVVSRKSKKPSGFDPDGWVLSILEEDARIYQEKIGFISERKIQGLEAICNNRRESSRYLIPYMNHLIADLKSEVYSKFEELNTEVKEEYENSLNNTFNHILFGRKNPSYQYLKQVLLLASDFGLSETETFKRIESIHKRNFFFDPIVEITQGRSVVMDIEVDDPSHCFVGNGIVNHNTVSAIAIMQKLKRDGFNEDENTNGRYLYVAPKALVGNMDKEVRIFLDEGNKNDLLGRLDAVSYEDFGRSMQRDGTYRIPKSLSSKLGEGVWELEKYVAIFFDEAQAFKKLGAKHTKAAFNLYHPRKISLTASPMEKEPKEAFILSAISNNIDLTAKGVEGRENRKKMLQFKNRFLKTVGGRVVDIKDDPDTMHDLDVWVKRNIFYAEKTEVKDTATPLPELKKQAESALMSAETKALYKETSSEIAFYMEGMLKKFKKELSDAKGQTTAKEYEQLFGRKLRPFMKILNSLSNYPNIAIKQIATAMLGDRPRDLLTQKEFDSCKKFFAKLSKKFEPQELSARADFAPNPKINTVVKKLNDFLEVSENSRSLVFSDDKKMVSLTARDVSKKVPGIHIAADDAEINFYESGKKLTEFRIPVSIGNHEKVLDDVAPLVFAIGGEKLTREEAYQNKKNMKIRERFLADPVATFSLPFTAKEYRLFPQLPEHPVYNKKYEASKWQKFVLDEIVGKNIQDVKSLNLLGSVYSTGQNLQQFDKVIHTDRNTWNSEEMKQRTARAWRQGQINPVEEVIVDAVYDDVDYEKADQDPTLDVVRKFHQEMESDLFNNIIKRSQETDISKEYKEFRPRGSSFMKVDKQNAFFALSPYLKRSNPINEGSEE